MAAHHNVSECDVVVLDELLAYKMTSKCWSREDTALPSVLSIVSSD